MSESVALSHTNLSSSHSLIRSQERPPHTTPHFIRARACTQTWPSLGFVNIIGLLLQFYRDIEITNTMEHFLEFAVSFLRSKLIDLLAIEPTSFDELVNLVHELLNLQDEFQNLINFIEDMDNFIM